MSPIIDVCPLEELPAGGARIVRWEDLEIGIFNCAGELLAIEAEGSEIKQIIKEIPE